MSLGIMLQLHAFSRKVVFVFLLDPWAIASQVLTHLSHVMNR